MRLKKLLACGLATAMLFSMSITAMAADLTSDEQGIISALQSAGVPANYVTQAQNYLASSSVTVTADQATTIKAKITEAKTTAGSVTSLASLSADQKTAIAADLADAGNAIGVKVTFNATANSITATDSTGKVVFDAALDSATTSSSTVVKATGATMNTSIYIIAVLAMALVGCGIVVSKKRLADEIA